MQLLAGRGDHDDGKGYKNFVVEYKRSKKELYECLVEISKHRDSHVNTVAHILVVSVSV